MEDEILGANESEFAELTDDTVVDTDAEPTSDENASGSEVPESEAPVQEEEQPQQIDVNAIAAAARRKAEGEMKARDAEYARRFGHLTNPKTGQPIRSERDYLAALDAQEEMKAKEQLKQNGIDPNVLDQFIANNPAVRQAQAVMAQAQQQAMYSQINNDIAELGRIDPSIVSLETVPPDVIQYCMSRGMDSLVDAYKIVKFGQVNSTQQAAIQQAAINQAKGKSHLNPVNGVAVQDNSVEIPQNERSLWESMFPDKSYEERKKLYNETL